VLQPATGGVRKYVGMTGACRATAWRDISELLNHNMLAPGLRAGRSIHHDLAIPGWAWVAPN
jgi:hypothetical protein